MGMTGRAPLMGQLTIKLVSLMETRASFQTSVFKSLNFILSN